MEARTAFVKLLTDGGVAPAMSPVVSRENDEAAIIRQNREALNAWTGKVVH